MHQTCTLFALAGFVQVLLPEV